MKIIYEQDGAAERIKEKALALSGTEEPQHMEVLFDAALSYSLGVCGRDDVPYEMETAVAIVLAGLLKDGFSKPVTSLKRGDVAVTYASGDMEYFKNALAPFIKLRCVK